ncbi:unnamed protein product [Blepharisma stoltei]|uniref:Uncharacterized protein n=1 Tax=Blepharisma stoltei TaxID=1481888 RepID=A0AAU9JVT3_9CILI|nr:unnamed protein product [Blepharisma stoltei]
MEYINSDKTMEIRPMLSVFTNMFSLLNMSPADSVWPMSLVLPSLERLSGVNDKKLLPKIQQADSSKSENQSCERVCTHRDKKIYAKNMCNNCYRRFGKDKLAWTCPHRDRQHYAKGKCQLCYLKEYHRSRVFEKRHKRQDLK